MADVALIANETAPVKLLAGVTVKVMPPAVAPEVTVDDVVHGVRAKSALLEETKSATRVPLELA